MPRSFRPDSDELWHDFVRAANDRGTTATRVLNACMRSFVAPEEPGALAERMVLDAQRLAAGLRNEP